MPSINKLATEYIQQPALSAVQAPFNALKRQEMEQGIAINDLQMQKLQQELDAYKFKDTDDAIEWWNEIKGMLNLGNYDAMKNAAILKGANPALFPDISTFGNNEQNLQDWIYQADRQLAKIKEKLPKEKEPKAMKTWVLPNGKTVNLPNNVAPPEGAVPYSTGMDIEVGPEGTRIRTGVGPGSTTVEKKTKGAIEEKIIGGHEQLARMNAIYSEFKPEYQEIGTRLANAWTGIKAKFGQNVGDQDAKSLTKFKKFQRKAIENINLYIKELTGAQMSEKEADRLRLAQPDPGEKWWQGDDPITFKAKMDDVLKMTRAAVARYEYYRAKGLGDSQIKAIINDNSAVSLEAIASKM